MTKEIFEILTSQKFQIDNNDIAINKWHQAIFQHHLMRSTINRINVFGKML
ncbi:hypothetical protein Hs30E_04500 [Lactococcus hodotermopsidis]|uniref:Uncharacterized protein n=1 Tax=Pseudolactococcus hodotermopsidis TaxID=2709157 RepID=A0A6A0B906_9LACT|nr:hypothetical protein Hs30E_04500 [Lactococcus hodotermopsidis]